LALLLQQLHHHSRQQSSPSPHPNPQHPAWVQQLVLHPVNLPLALALLVPVNLPLVQVTLPLDLVCLPLGQSHSPLDPVNLPLAHHCLPLGQAHPPSDPVNLPLAHHCLPPVLVSLGLLLQRQSPLAQASQLHSARQLVHHQCLQVQLCSLLRVTSLGSAAKSTSAVVRAHLHMFVCTAAFLLLLSHVHHLSVCCV